MMYADDLVSIVTPAYNAAGTICETIESIRGQSHASWELLVAEDCGSDDTRALVQAIAATDNRVRLIELPANGGPATARNRALSQAKGRWLAFLDADDLWLPGKLERQLAFHRAHLGAVLSFTGYRRISASGAREGGYIAPRQALTYRKLLGNTAIATSSVIVDRKLAGPFVMPITYYDDFACWLALLKDGGLAVGLDEDLMRYRVQEGSVSRDKRKSAFEVWRAYRRIEKLGRLASAWYFSQYAAHALKKYRQF